MKLIPFAATQWPIASEPIVRLLERASGKSERELIALGVRELARLFGGRGSFILLEDTPRVVYSTLAENTDVAIQLARYPELRAALESKQVAVVEDVHADAALADVRGLLPGALRSVIALPLYASTQVLGAILIQSPQALAIDAERLQVANILSRLIATLLELAQLRGTQSERRLSRRDEPGAQPLAIRTSDEHRRLLVIEDDEDHAELLGIRLQQEGFEVDTAASGVAGLRQAFTARPEMILLDVSMPDLDGFEVARRLGEEPLTADIPILFLSGMPDLVTRVRELHHGDVDFLAKPYSFAELQARIERSLAQRTERAKLQAAANRDELTGLGNLRALENRMVFEESVAKRYGTSVAIVVLDFDKLKALNDQHGHVVGSQALAAVGKVLNKAVRETDLAARYGGDEFVVLLSHAVIGDGIGFAERVTQQIRALELGSEKLKISVSAGVAALRPDKDHPISLLMKNADLAVYEAKRQGGNRVCVSRP